MKYDFSHKYQIRINGSSEEIMDWVREIHRFMHYESNLPEVERQLEGLERIIESEAYQFGMHHRIYVKKGNLLYCPTANEDEKREIDFNYFKREFDKVRPKMDEKYKKIKNYGKRDDLKKKSEKKSENES